jgi:hypothetical protein
MSLSATADSLPFAGEGWGGVDFSVSRRATPS